MEFHLATQNEKRPKLKSFGLTNNCAEELGLFQTFYYSA